MDFELLKSWCDVGPGINPCWNWKGRLTPQGYPATDPKHGKRALGAKNENLHHAVIMEHPNYFPGAHARHGCNNRRCCSPMHVVPGTHADNMVDIVLSGNHNKAKLTSEIVQEIRKSKLKRAELSVIYGVSPSTIKKAKIGETWKFVPREET